MPKYNFESSDSTYPRSTVPHWDRHRRALWFGEILVKRFRVPADNQELILVAFEEQGWPGRIDDPLPRNGIADPSERLHGAIKRLNGCQAQQVLRFSADGRGKGIVWEAIVAQQGPHDRTGRPMKAHR